MKKKVHNLLQILFFFSEFRIFVMGTLVLESTPYAKLGSLTKASDATAVRGIEGSSVMKVFINFPFKKNVVFILHSENKVLRKQIFIEGKVIKNV